jgi:hypothetical protein
LPPPTDQPEYFIRPHGHLTKQLKLQSTGKHKKCPDYPPQSAKLMAGSIISDSLESFEFVVKIFY